MLSHPPTWRAAWTERATATDGFWALPEPTRHFRTSADIGAWSAEALLRLVRGTDTGIPIGTVLDVGAGSGALLTGLQRLDPTLRLVGLDQTVRPAALAPEIAWCRDRWDVVTARWTGGAAEALLRTWSERSADRDDIARPGLLAVCSEWLDDLPTAIAVRRDGRWCEATAAADDVDGSGGGTNRFAAGPLLIPRDAAWVARWSGGDTSGTGGLAVVEPVTVGTARDDAWHWVIDTVAGSGGGLAVMIDYGRRVGDPDPGLRGYLAGQEVEPHPEQLMNLTAGVTVDSLVEVGRAAGARTVLLARQADVLAPLEEQFRTEPAVDPMQQLTGRSELARLRDPAGLGGHWWLAQSVAPARVGGPRGDEEGRRG